MIIFRVTLTTCLLILAIGGRPHKPARLQLGYIEWSPVVCGRYGELCARRLQFPAFTRLDRQVK